MPAQCVPQDESRRLQMLASLDVLDRPDEEIFSEYVSLAAELLDAPTALISLVDERRQWFAGRYGLDAQETERSISFCAVAIGQSDDVMWVEDAREDSRFRDNPLVTEGPRIRFYAGAPIVVNGFFVGALCALSPVPRPRDATQARILARLARILAERFERRHCELALQQAMEISADAIIECDDEGVITAWRLGAERLFGFAAAEAVGQSITLIVPPELRKAHLEGMARWGAGAAQRLLRRVELAAVRKDGSPIDVELASVSWHSHGRRVITTAVRDISHRKAQAASLLQAKMQAEAANVSKTAFLANISHDIRTPLNGVVGIADLLAASPLQPEQAELVEIIRTSSRQLQLLVRRIDRAGRPGERAALWSEPARFRGRAEPASGETFAVPAAGQLDVLLADDDPTNRRVAELILSAAGASVTAVGDGAEAVDAFRRQAFDLVLMDMMMPVMDGVEAVRRIREAEHERSGARTPVIMLTANTLPEHLERSLEAGADLHVPKPITSRALLNAISQALDAAAL
jgi:PAS domain S-box-containing protein